MKASDERFARQVRLSEVGLEGQARLLAADVVVGDQMACEYLRRAGVRALYAPSADVPTFPHGASYQNPACRELAAGAWLALTRIRDTLGDPTP